MYKLRCIVAYANVIQLTLFVCALFERVCLSRFKAEQ